MPIAFDAFTYSSQASTYNHTCSGSDRILFAATRGVCSGVTYGGVALTLLDTMTLEDAIAAFTPAKFWYLVNPLSGVNSVICADGCATSMVISYNGVKQTNPLNTKVVNASAINATSLTTNVITTVNQCWIIVLEASYAFGGAPSAGAGLIKRGSATGSTNVPALFDSNGPQTPAGTFSGTTTQGAAGAKIEHIAQAFEPASGGGGGGGNDKPPKRDKPGVGVPTVLIGNTIYATPVNLVNIEWVATGAAILEGSMDELTWITLGSLPGAGMQYTPNVVVPYIRPSVDITVILRKKKEKF